MLKTLLLRHSTRRWEDLHAPRIWTIWWTPLECLSVQNQASSLCTLPVHPRSQGLSCTCGSWQLHVWLLCVLGLHSSQVLDSGLDSSSPRSEWGVWCQQEANYLPPINPSSSRRPYSGGSVPCQLALLLGHSAIPSRSSTVLSPLWLCIARGSQELREMRPSSPLTPFPFVPVDARVQC